MENYEVIRNIGKGSFGMVNKIRRKTDGKVLVWKELNYGIMSEKEKQQLVAEVNILRELRHPNIVRYYDRIIEKKQTKIYIIMEHCEGGDMGALLKKCKRDNDYIAEDVIWKVFTQILMALNECHNRKQGKILHRDLKPANIFLDGQNNIKLGDFGLSRVMGEDSVFASTHVGTPYYMSPEQINESRYNEKSDIWSAGCLLYEISALKPPFEAKNHLSLAIKIKSGKFDRLPLRYSEDLQRLIQAMLNNNPDRRPSVEDLLKIPQVSMRVKEKKLREKLSQAKQKEEELKKKEEELKKMEAELEKRAEEVKKNELKFKEKEKRLRQMEYQNDSLDISSENSDHSPSNVLNSDYSGMINHSNIQQHNGSGGQYMTKYKSNSQFSKENLLLENQTMIERKYSANTQQFLHDYNKYKTTEFGGKNPKRLLEDITNLTNNL